MDCSKVMLARSTVVKTKDRVAHSRYCQAQLFSSLKEVLSGGSDLGPEEGAWGRERRRNGPLLQKQTKDSSDEGASYLMDVGK